MSIPTNNYNFQLPTVGGDDGNWGYLLNGNWSAIDNFLLSVQTSYFGSVAPAFPTNPDDKKGTFWFNDTDVATTGFVPLTVWDGTEYVLIGALNPSTHTFNIPTASFMEGQIVPYAGISLATPSFWKFCDGSPVNRATYLNLFNALNKTFTGTTNTTTTIAVADTTGFQTGWFVSGTGIPAATTIVSIVPNTSITINNAATNAATESLVAGPYGIGDGLNTFNLPNLQGKLPLGQDGSTFNLGATGGAINTTLTVNQMADHNHLPASDTTNALGRGFLITYPQNTVNPPATRGVQDSSPTNTLGSSIRTTGGIIQTNGSPYTGPSPVNLMNPYQAVNYIIFTGVNA